jgi:P4 family phage/plasmid primase-like protien
VSERGPAGSWQHFCYFGAQGSIDLERTLAELPSDDLAASRVILAEFDQRLHYLVQSETWLIWDGRCHQPDEGDDIAKLLADWASRYQVALGHCHQQDHAEFMRGFAGQPAAAEAAASNHLKRWDGKGKYVATLRKSAGKSSLRSYLAGLAGCADAYFNEQHPGWLNCANGTVDLSTGLIKPHDVADRLTYCLGTAYVPDARCPRFGSLVRRVCDGSDEVPRYLMKLLGYGILGDNREQKIVFISGPTASGKSQLLRIVSEVLGPLAHESQADLITLVRHGRNARTENSIRGKRVVTITETSEFMTIDEGQLKRLTGEAQISVNQHYAKAELKTPVTWLIVIATNQMPTLANFDGAMRRRIVVIPGGPSLAAWEQDARIAEKIIESEAEGVLAALVRACVRYQSEGVRNLPGEIQLATDAYAAEQNTVEQFLADVCEPAMADEHIGQSALWTGYQRWAKGGSHLSRNAFYEHLEHQGLHRDAAQRRFGGIKWKNNVPDYLLG